MADTATNPSTTTMADLLGKTVPALSATSDMPVVEAGDTPETVIEETKPEVVETKPEDEGVETAPETKEPVVETKPDNTPPEIKREITKARNKQREAEARATAAEKAASDAAAAAQAATEALKALSTPKLVETATDEPRPSRDAFDHPDKYEAALTEWATKQGERAAAAKAETARVENERKAASDANEAQFRTAVEAYNAKRDAVLEEIPDYVEVAEAESVQITYPMRDAILAADNGPHLAYHLGKNPDEALRISKLNPMQQVFEMGKLAASIAKPAKVAVSKAPAPIVPLGSRSTAAEKSADEMSMDEYAAHRRAQRTTERAGTRPH